MNKQEYLFLYSPYNCYFLWSNNTAIKCNNSNNKPDAAATTMLKGQRKVEKGNNQHKNARWPCDLD
jgi:hypothetical protein